MGMTTKADSQTPAEDIHSVANLLGTHYKMNAV